jgi:hypothetical protein
MKMDLKEAGREDVERMHLARGRVQWWVLVNAGMTCRFYKRLLF